MKILGVITKIAIFAGIIILLGLFGYALFGKREFFKPSPLIGSESPDFTLNLFNGDQLKLSDLRGKAVLLNFWASWCGPCRDEAPALERSWDEYKNDGVIFVGVNVWDDRNEALKYVNKFGGGYFNGVDPKGEIAVEYGIAGVPETYFISPSGIITDKYTGVLTEEIIDYFLERALSSSAAAGLSEKK